MNKVILYDVAYDRTAQDLLVSAGDIDFVDSHDDILDQLIEDAHESSFNSMKNTLRNWGNEGYNFNFTTVDNLPKDKQETYTGEMFDAMAFLIKNLLSWDVNYAPSGFSGFEYDIEAVLNDITGTSYVRTIKWDQSAHRCEVV